MLISCLFIGVAPDYDNSILKISQLIYYTQLPVNFIFQVHTHDSDIQ